MPHLKNRKGQLATSVAAIAMAAALALPAVAAADDLPNISVEMNKPELTATANGAKTDLTMTLPKGAAFCSGPFVVEGTKSETELLAANSLSNIVYPTDFADLESITTQELLEEVQNHSPRAKVGSATASPTAGPPASPRPSDGAARPAPAPPPAGRRTAPRPRPAPASP